ncbi:ABC transporter ATP-binding protein [Lipingzhangella sp. LS1_29]|uniref:ABC transporter ATP-binding protein n=1 Tax=Lipingzhangella rawalii TaxID=2055835 RepID=A0ABU2H5X8_9ACTN|nr:ABC transporter ATP-binding protein [Lipingzhangella rawalii]MDS1270034.1 ABC transporter ATP-binding protein [Lipingzhangella rawalii]
MHGQVLRMRGVGVRRGQSWLVRDIDWVIEEDDRWVIIGPNGAGKTTLLRIAAAQLFPTTGEVDLLEERLGSSDVFELRPRIGFASAALTEQIPETERPLDLVLSAAYAVVGRWREEYAGMDEDRARSLLRDWGMDTLAERSFGTLSEGERKRAQIARAMMSDPELLLLDEPAAGLDLGAREELVGRLSALAQDIDAPATVLVTHHVEEIPPHFTHAMLVRSGGVVAAGPIEEALTPEHLSDTFGMRLKVEQVGDRWSARAD